jgi:hypothetical protein
VTLTSKFFADAIFPHIVVAKPVDDSGRRLVLYMDNASRHRARLTARNLEENRIAASPRRAFSSDLPRSVFFLFGALKGQFSGGIFESLDELVEAIHEIASATRRTTLERVFPEWEKRLQQCIDINGAHAN